MQGSWYLRRAINPLGGSSHLAVARGMMEIGIPAGARDRARRRSTEIDVASQLRRALFAFRHRLSRVRAIASSGFSSIAFTMLPASRPRDAESLRTSTFAYQYCYPLVTVDVTSF